RGLGSSPDGAVSGRGKSSGCIPEEHGYGAAGQIGNGEIRNAIFIEVARNHCSRSGAGGERASRRRSELPESDSCENEQDAGLEESCGGFASGHSEVLLSNCVRTYQRTPA